jgi:ABC-2 type transport system ATP-binding protein
MIEASDLSKEYGEVRALKQASFSIANGEVVGLLGPNGAGKTTLMKILSGYLHPTAGSAQIDGVDVVADPLTVQSKIGYLPESAPLYPDMVVQEYLQMMAELRQVPPERQVELISAAVRHTGLEDFLVRPIGQLSKGYRQRVGLAQAILHKPSVLILDEPSSGLDPTQIVEIRGLIKELAQNATVLLSTHILSEVEVSCERVLIIAEGELSADARLDELRQSGAALARVEGSPADVEQALQRIDGVTSVAQVGKSNGYTSFQVRGDREDLCPQIFDAVKSGGWRLAELRPDQQTLESVFRDIVERKIVAEGGQAR